MKPPISIVWFRQDLRIADHPALHEAARRGPILPVFIWAPHEEAEWAPGGAARWRLHHSLASLAKQLEQLGSPLVLREGDSAAVLSELAEQVGATAVYWNRRYEAAGIERDTAVKRTLQAQGLHAESCAGRLLHEPWTIATKTGQPYRVFTPFWRACLAADCDRRPLPEPKTLEAPDRQPKSISLDSLRLLPRIGWDEQFHAEWKSGAPAAEQALQDFVSNRIHDYQEDRNRIDVPGWSQLSPHLSLGELSPRQVWAAVEAAVAKSPSKDLARSAETFLSEIGWREFAYHLLYHFPDTTRRPFRDSFEDFPWVHQPDLLQRWQQGQTGFPIVDAAMRQLWTVGWMPNRARMIVASFLTKDLLIGWQAGAEWFWDTLIDADLASNTMGWQWTAGCGADAAPYFRVFNPVAQAEKFDPHGEYIRRWVPELAELETPSIFKPWEADEDVLVAAGVTLGETYPHPIVDHAQARREALAALETTKS